MFRHAIWLALVITAVFDLTPGSAQVYPTRPITLVVPFPAGGTTDLIGRTVASKMSVSLGQPVYVENISGGGGSIGVGRVAHATPDGYTLDIGQLGNHVLNGAIYTLQYDLVRDFEPIALLATGPFLIAGKATLPADDLNGLIAWLRKNPNSASQGTTAIGTQLIGMFFKDLTATQFQFVPYRGAAPATQDLVAGQIPS